MKSNISLEEKQLELRAQLVFLKHELTKFDLNMELDRASIEKILPIARSLTKKLDMANDIHELNTKEGINRVSIIPVDTPLLF